MRVSDCELFVCVSTRDAIPSSKMYKRVVRRVGDQTVDTVCQERVVAFYRVRQVPPLVSLIALRVDLDVATSSPEQGLALVEEDVVLVEEQLHVGLRLLTLEVDRVEVVDGGVGELENICYKGCTADTDCSPVEACINGRCQNPCDSRSPCDADSRCEVRDRQTTCLPIEPVVAEPECPPCQRNEVCDRQTLTCRPGESENY